MRFLIGVLTGGALTWAASLMFGDVLPSPGPAIRWLDAQIGPEGIGERIRGATVAAVADDKPPASERVPIPEPAPRASERAATPSPEPNAIEPPAALPQSVVKSPTALARADEEPTIAPTPNDTDDSLAESVDELAVVVAPESNGWESAWVPFQTQRSARGFAHVLTRQVQHPFEVRREATHRYRVTFAYADQAERERVLAAVRSLTGIRP